jgi:hypothetical protein
VLLLNPQQCSPIDVAVEMRVHDLVTGQEQTVFTWPTQQIPVACMRLVRMIVNPVGSQQFNACDVVGNRPTIRWEVSLEDHNHQQLDPQQVLAQPGSTPFVASVSRGQGGSAVGSPTWLYSNKQYELVLGSMTPGLFQTVIDFTGALKPGFIRDAQTAHFDSNLTLVAPNVAPERVAASAGAGGLLALLSGLAFVFLILPRSGYVLNGRLVLQLPTGEERMTALPSKKRATITFARVNMYGDSFIMWQDQKDWDVMHLQPYKNGRKCGPEKTIRSNGAAMLENQADPNGPPALLEHQAQPNYATAQKGADRKRRGDRLISRAMLLTALVLAMLATGSTWTMLRLGCG